MGNLTPSQLSEQELVIVASDGSVIGYKPDAVTGNFVEVPNGFTNNYSTYNFTEEHGLAERPDYESLSKTLNISSLYGLPGETINIDVDHLNPSINSQISFTDMRYHWEDGLEWLGVSPTGLLYGVVPQGFENGGANIVAIHPTLGEHVISLEFHCPLQKRIMEKRYLLAIHG